MAAPTTEMPGTISTTAEGNGLLKTIRSAAPQVVLMLGFSGTSTSAVVAVKGRMPGGTVYYPLFGWTQAGTPIADPAAIALTDSATARYFFDATGCEDVEVYCVSGTISMAVEGVVRAGTAQPVVNTTVGTQVTVASAGAIKDANANELIKFPSSVSSAVNEVTVSNAATTASPSIAATGDDTNISVKATGKGTGVIERTKADGIGGVGLQTPTTITTAGAATYTIAQLKTGLLLRDPNGASRSDVTPTGTLIAAGLPGVADGAGFLFIVKNDADAAEVITVTAGTDVTLVGDMAIGQNELKFFLLVVTSVASHTATIYGFGSIAHNT